MAAGKCTPAVRSFFFQSAAGQVFNIFYLCVHIAFSPESAEAASRRKRVKRGAAKKKRDSRDQERGVVGRERIADGEKGELSGWWVGG